MDRDNIPLMTGVSVISEMHDYFRESGHDDLEHIIKISLVIKGIYSYLKNYEASEQEIDNVLAELKEYGKKLWIESCVDAADENESESEVREETDYIFEYVFENHEYPY